MATLELLKFGVVVALCGAASFAGGSGGASVQAGGGRGQLVETSGQVEQIDFNREELTLMSGGHRVTVKADANTTLFSHGDLTTFLDLREGQHIRAYCATNHPAALWLEADGKI